MSILKALMNGASLMTIVARAPEGAGNITMADLVTYFNAYKAKYSADCTLSVDVMEELLGSAKDDDALLEAMHETMTATDEDDDRSRELTAEDMKPDSAYSYAVRMSKELTNHIITLGQAALENKRGAAVIMFDLYKDYGRDTVETAWPKPGSYKPGQGHADIEAVGNAPWDKEDTSITKADGTTGKGVKSFYQEVVDYSPHGKALLDEKAEIKKVVGDARKTKRKASKIDTLLTNFKGSIIRAVNLAQKMAFVNASTGMHCEVEMDDDNPLQVAEGTKIIFIQDKTAQTKFDTITIGQFLALKVAEGATYAAIVGTTQRQPKAGTGPVSQEVNVNNVDDFDKVTAAYATFFDKLNEALGRKDAKAYNALLTRLNAAGSDDLLLSMNTIMNSIEGILSKPGIDKRLGALIADGGKAKAA